MCWQPRLHVNSPIIHPSPKPRAPQDDTARKPPSQHRCNSSSASELHCTHDADGVPRPIAKTARGVPEQLRIPINRWCDRSKDAFRPEYDFPERPPNAPSGSHSTISKRTVGAVPVAARYGQPHSRAPTRAACSTPQTAGAGHSVKHDNTIGPTSFGQPRPHEESGERVKPRGRTQPCSPPYSQLPGRLAGKPPLHWPNVPWSQEPRCRPLTSPSAGG